MDKHSVERCAVSFKRRAALTLTAKGVSVCGRQAAVKFQGEGVGNNGRVVRFEGIDVFDINANGRVQRVRGDWDAAALFAQGPG